tara:strand:+ start:1638 stop:2144 length:507 start_codon:yes stop_codon:yes gene_type:complete
MKTFKELKTNIFESGEVTLGGGFGDTFVKTNPNSALKDYGKGVFELGEEDNLNRVNAFLNAFFKKPIDDPKANMGMLKAKMNVIGLDFECGKDTKVQQGTNVFKLTRFGGVFGKSPETPHDEFERSDGFANGASYNLVMDVVPDESGLYKINAKVVGQADETNGESEA